MHDRVEKTREIMKNLINVRDYLIKYFEKMKKYLLSMDLWKDVFETAGFVIVMLVVIKFCFFELRWIPSTSMVPTLLVNDRLVVERYSRFYSTPQRGDIMVFYPPETILKNDLWSLFSRYTGIFCKDVAYIKRVVGMPGDKLEIKKSQKNDELAVYINDVEIDEPYINQYMKYISCDAERFCGPMTIPEKHYFMLGDNRGNSADSRFWGLLSEDRFIGRALLRFWPLTRLKMFMPPEYVGIEP